MKTNTKILLAFPLLFFSLLYAFLFGVPVSADDPITLRVGIYENSPKIFTDENGDAAGFWPEIIAYIADEEGWQIEYVHGTWSESLERLGNNEIDIMPDVAYTEERSKLYDFSNEAVYVSWSRVYAREGVEIESILDLEGKTIAVLQGSVNYEGPEGIEVLVREFDVDCTFLEADSYTEVFELIESGEADAGVVSKDFGYQHEDDFNLVKTSIVFQPSSLYFAFPKDSSLTPYLIGRIDSHIQALKVNEDSIYYRALENWFGIKLGEKSVFPGWIKWSLIGVGGLALLLGGGSLILRSQVRARTKELKEEISQRQEVEGRVRHLNLVMKALRGVNQLMTREKDKERMIQEACEVLVDTRGYERAWIVLVDENKRSVSVANAGLGSESPVFLEQMKSGKYPQCVKELWRQDSPFLGLDCPGAKHKGCILAEAHSRRGVYRCRLEDDGKVYGILGVTLPSEMFADEEEKALFLELGNDLAFALKNIEEEEKRKRAEEALRESEVFRSGLLTNSPTPINVINPDGSIRYVSPALEKLTGFSAEELIGQKPPYPYWPKEEVDEIMKGFKKAMRQGSDRIEEPYQNKNGERFWVEITSTPVKKDGKFQHLLASWVDITKRKKAEEEIAGLAKFPNENPASVMRIARDGTVLYANKPALALLNEWKSQVGQLLPKYWREFALNVLNSGKRKDVEVNVGKRIFTVTFAPIAGEDYLNLYGLDITERKQAEGALRESEARYRAVIEGAHDMIQSVGLDGRIIFVNKSWRDTLGYTEAELSSLNLFDIIHPDSRAHCRELMAEVTKGKPVQDIEAAFLTKDGRKILVEGNAAPRYIGDRVVATQGVFRDVTETKLKEMEYQNILQTTTDGFWIVDSAGRFLDVNNAYCALIGYSREELLNMSIKDIEAVEKPEETARRIRQIIKTGHGRFETRHRCKDGSIVDIEVSTTYAGAGDGRLFVFIRDITERKRAEDALRKSEEKFYKAFYSSPNAMALTTSKEGRFLEVNDGFLRLNGFSREEVIGRTSKELGIWVNPKDRVRIVRIMREKGRVADEEYKSRTKSGEIHTMLFSAEPIEIAGESCMISSATDITERKLADEKLRDEATRHHILIDESSDGIVVLDEKGKVYEANKRFAEMLGYTPEEVRELNVWDWEFQFPPEQVAEMIRTVDETGDHFETKHRRKDGTTYDVEISTNGVIYAGQKLIFCVCRDITARKQAEAALRQSEEKLRVILESIPQGVTVTDLDGKILEVNNAVLRLHGYNTRQELIGRNAFEFIAKEGHARARDNLKETLETGRSGAIEYTFIRKDGTTFPAQLSAALIQDESAKPIGFVAVTEDITERRKMQEQLVITDRLASVGELAAGIAHELNNPLTGVIGFSQLLMSKEMPKDIKEDVEVVYNEAQRTSQVVKNLLTFARKHSAIKEKVNINDVINKVLELRSYEQNLENITVDARLDSDLPEVMGDYFQLQQVFLNIVINAEYFMKEAHHKGKLTITTEKVGKKIRVSFADDGPGIAKDDLGHIFDPFFTTKEVGRGTGLGLSICHGIVTEHGGRIYVESELGKGATFIVELPIGAAERKGGAA